MRTFEYRIIEFGTNLENDYLNYLGRNGWELCHGDGCGNIILKREIEEDNKEYEHIVYSLFELHEKGFDSVIDIHKLDDLAKKGYLLVGHYALPSDRYLENNHHFIFRRQRLDTDKTGE